MIIKHKYRAKPTERKGRKYGSKLEARYAARLEYLKVSGKLLFWLEQVPFILPGGVVYRLDFMEFWAPSGDDQGDVVFTEVKGFDTPVGVLKLKQVQEIYGIEIKVVRSR